MSNQNELASRLFGEAGSDQTYIWPAEAFEGIIVARSLAFLADLAIVTIAVVAAWIVFGILGALTFGLLWPGISLTPLIALAYFTFTLGGPRSATPGMRWQGVEMRTWNGHRPGYLQATIQTILFYMIMPMTFLLLLVPFFNYRRRCLHDYLCGTVYVRSPALVST